MQTKTIILVGPQGSGKGTQAALLKQALTATGDELLHAETGGAFRSLIQSEHDTAARVRSSLEQGNIQPLFLAVTLWGSLFIEQYNDTSHMLIDGFPRRVEEAEILDDAFSFYGRNHVDVVLLDMTDELAIERMKGRGREDDTEDSMRERLSWYHRDTEPVLGFFKAHDRYTVHSIDGSHTIEEVHAEIKSRIVDVS